MTAEQITQALLITGTLLTPLFLDLSLALRPVKLKVLTASAAGLTGIVAICAGAVFFDYNGPHGGMVAFLWIYLICCGVAMIFRHNRECYVHRLW